jgi:hypothetical protein
MVYRMHMAHCVTHLHLKKLLGEGGRRGGGGTKYQAERCFLCIAMTCHDGVVRHWHVSYSMIATVHVATCGCQQYQYVQDPHGALMGSNHYVHFQVRMLPLLRNILYTR